MLTFQEICIHKPFFKKYIESKKNVWQNLNSIMLKARAARFGEISPFGLLFKGPGNFFGVGVGKMVCCSYFMSLEGVWFRYFGLSNWTLMQIFWLFLIWQLFGLLFPKFGHFFPNLLVTLYKSTCINIFLKIL